MKDQWTDVLGTRPPEVTLRTGGRVGPGGDQALFNQPLSRPWGASTPGRMVFSDDEVLERTLEFSGSYVSDDGNATIRRSIASLEYSGARFTGYCAVCSQAGLTPPSGEPLRDVRAAVQFVAAHRHEEVD
jgi:hypothetical protein